jgi:hypothetical protein
MRHEDPSDRRILRKQDDRWQKLPVPQPPFYGATVMNVSGTTPPATYTTASDVSVSR